MNPTENNQQQPSPLYTEKDVLGQDKSSAPVTATTARPGRIFLILAIAVAAVICVWLLRH